MVVSVMTLWVGTRRIWGLDDRGRGYSGLARLYGPYSSRPYGLGYNGCFRMPFAALLMGGMMLGV